MVKSDDPSTKETKPKDPAPKAGSFSTDYFKDDYLDGAGAKQTDSFAPAIFNQTTLINNQLLRPFHQIPSVPKAYWSFFPPFAPILASFSLTLVSFEYAASPLKFKGVATKVSLD